MFNVALWVIVGTSFYLLLMSIKNSIFCAWLNIINIYYCRSQCLHITITHNWKDILCSNNIALLLYATNVISTFKYNINSNNSQNWIIVIRIHLIDFCITINDYHPYIHWQILVSRSFHCVTIDFIQKYWRNNWWKYNNYVP